MFADKFEHLDDKYTLLSWPEEGIENLSSLISLEEIEFIIKSSAKENLSLRWILPKLIEKRDLPHNSLIIKKRAFNSFYEEANMKRPFWFLN